MSQTFPNASPDAPVTGQGWGWIMAYGVVSILLGLFAFVSPFAATFAATLVVGIYLVAAGIVAIGSALFGKGHEGRLYAGLFGVVSVLIGLMLALQPASGAVSLTLLIAIWLGVRGAMEIALGMRFNRGRGMMIAMGVLNIVLAAIVVATLPWSALTLPGYVLGLSFLFGGVNAIYAALHHRKGASAFAIPG